MHMSTEMPGAEPTRARRLLTAAAAGCLLALAVPGPARAEPALTGSTPAEGQKVAPGTNVIALTFDDLADGGTGRITVTGVFTVLTGKAVVVGGQTLCAAMQPLTDGAYTVHYDAASSDGRPVSGRYSFRV